MRRTTRGKQPKKEYEGELLGISEMPESAKSDGSPESLARMAEVRAQLEDPSSELGRFFAEMEGTQLREERAKEPKRRATRR